MRIKGLDGLRAIAFLLVFSFHAGWLDFGWLGVQLFFVLSGFLITGILLDMKSKLAGKDYFIKFYGRRFLRIFPLYYFYLFTIWLVVTWMVAIDFKVKYMEMFKAQFPYALGYVYDFYMASNLFERTSHFLTHFWSLAVEEQFYIIWPLLIFLTPHKKERNIFISVIVFSIFFRTAIMIWPNAATVFSLKSIPSQVIYGLPFSHMEAFAFGALLTMYDFPKARMQFYILAAIVPLVGVASDLLATGKLGNIFDLGYPLFMSAAFKPVWGYSAWNYFFAVLLFGVARQGWFTRFLESRIMGYLGKISYGLYVYHFPIIWFVTAPFGLALKPLSIFPGMAALALTILLASVSYYLLEKPIIDLKDRYFSVETEQRLGPEPNPAS